MNPETKLQVAELDDLTIGQLASKYGEEKGMELDQPWLLSFITCAAPYAPEVGQPLSSQLLRERIHRVMSIAQYLQLSNAGPGCLGLRRVWQ